MLTLSPDRVVGWISTARQLVQLVWRWWCPLQRLCGRQAHLGHDPSGHPWKGVPEGTIWEAEGKGKKGCIMQVL